MDRDKILELLPSYGDSHPIVDMARTAIQEGAEPEEIIRSMVASLVEELNRYRPLPPEAGNHYHTHSKGFGEIFF